MKLLAAPRVFITSTLVGLVACSPGSETLKAPPSHAEILSTDSGGATDFVRGDLGFADPTADAVTGEHQLQGALAEAAPLLGFEPQRTALRRVSRDELGYAHFHFAQTKNDLEVVGADFLVHVDDQGTVYAVNGNADVTTAPSVTPSVSSATAQGTVAARGLTATEPALVYLRTQAGELRLAWQVVELGRSAGAPIKNEVYVDAASGEVIEVHPRIYHARNRAIHSANNQEVQPGTLKRAEGRSASNDQQVDAAYDNLGTVWDFYKNVLNRDSFDDKGGKLIATVHYGLNFGNAYWDGEQMVYGDGDQDELGPLAESLDVTGHELTHGVTEFTADLVYSGESGGLNEAMSDIMGGAIEAWKDGAVSSDTWLVGEDVWTPRTPGDALRYMDDPAKDGDSVDFYGDLDSWTDVHYSSGIANLAFKLLVTGGKHPRGKTANAVPGLGIEQARAIFYRALSMYMTSTTNFQGARTTTAQAAQDLYGANAVAAVHEAWTAVGVPGDPGGTAGGGGGDDGVTALENGVAATRQAGALDTEIFYELRVPAGARDLTFKISGGRGDADLYVRFGSKPSQGKWDYRPYKDGNDETVRVPTAKAGTYYLMLHGYSQYSGVKLLATFR